MKWYVQYKNTDNKILEEKYYPAGRKRVFAKTKKHAQVFSSRKEARQYVKWIKKTFGSNDLKVIK